MQLSRRELLMLDGSRRIAHSRVPKVAYALCLVMFVLAAIIVTWGVYESVTRPGPYAGNTLIASGLLLTLMASQLSITAYLTKSYGALVGKLQDRIDQLEAQRPLALTE